MKDSPAGCCDRHLDGLLPVDHVRDELLNLVRASTTECQVPLEAAAGRTLSQEITAPLSLPLRDHSAVDGYALGLTDNSARYLVRARTAAGEAAHSTPLTPAEAVQVFTGAPIPPGTVAVAMQEDVVRTGDQITLAAPPQAGENIRRGGEDLRKGDVLIPAGTQLDPRHVAILAASGLTEVAVARPVRIALFSSGKELCDPGAHLGSAAIYDSNRWMLKALLCNQFCTVDDLGILPDDRDVISATLVEAAEKADLILSTGGVSVGEEDHIFAALKQAGAAPRQCRMAVKPGKPVVFGQIGGSVVLGLPGNPVAALVSFLLLARPCITAMTGRKVPVLNPAPAEASFNWSRSPGRAEFFPARQVGCNDAGQPILTKLGRGGSARLKPLIEADGLARVSLETRVVNPGDALDWFPFHAGFSL